MDSRTKPQSGENIRADILIDGAASSNLPVGYRSSSSISSSSAFVKPVRYCCRYMMYSQRGVGKVTSERLLDEDDHGCSDSESVGNSCRLTVSVSVLLSSCCAKTKLLSDNARCGSTKMPASLRGVSTTSGKHRRRIPYLGLVVESKIEPSSG